MAENLGCGLRRGSGFCPEMSMFVVVWGVSACRATRAGRGPWDVSACCADCAGKNTGTRMIGLIPVSPSPDCWFLRRLL